MQRLGATTSITDLILNAVALSAVLQAGNGLDRGLRDAARDPAGLFDISAMLRLICAFATKRCCCLLFCANLRKQFPLKNRSSG